MRKTSKSAIALVAVIAVIGGIASLTFSDWGLGTYSTTVRETSPPDIQDSTQTEETVGLLNGSVGSETEVEDVGYSGQIIAGSTTPYVRYNGADFEKAKGEGKGIYVYVYATWCPLCAEERPKILDAFGGLNIQNIVGFESHWKDFQDTAEDSDLAREYSVASQHTHLFIGRDGILVYKKVGALEKGELESRLAEIAQA